VVIDDKNPQIVMGRYCFHPAIAALDVYPQRL
jgi:hypothetical protein